MENKENIQIEEKQVDVYLQNEKRRVQMVMILLTLSVLLIAMLISVMVEQAILSRLWVYKSEPTSSVLEVSNDDGNIDSRAGEQTDNFNKNVFTADHIAYKAENILGLYTAAGINNIDVFADSDRESQVLMQFQSGCTIPVIESLNKDGVQWDKISFYGFEGWIEDELLVKCADCELADLVTCQVYVDAGDDEMTSVYKENSESSDLMDSLVYGTGVEIIDVKECWGKITYDGKQGWVHLSEVFPYVPGHYSVNASGTGVNVRVEAKADSDRIDQLPVDSEVEIEEFQNGWGKIDVYGKDGWVMMKYMKMKQNDDT